MKERSLLGGWLRPFGSDLGPRFISSIILIPLTLFALVVGGLAFALVVGVAFAGFYREYDAMVMARTMPDGPPLLGNLLTGLVLLLALAHPMGGALAVLLVGAIGALIAAALGGEGRWWRFWGIFYVALVVLALLEMRGQDMQGVIAGLFLGAAIWLTDIGAYFSGRQFGGAKLSPDISPSKTWSGAIGGFALGTFGALVIWLIFTPSQWWIGVGLAIILSVVGQAGDLAESALKRYFRVKDSGDILPGHGGLMDRLDSLSLAALAMSAIGLAHGGLGHLARGFLFWG